MDFIYVFIYGGEWEDMIIFLSKEDAIQKSINHPNCRVEIFSKTNSLKDQYPSTNLSVSKSTIPSGYEPTYNYYQNGEFIHNSVSISSPKLDVNLN
jgi:hypothetical protein